MAGAILGRDYNPVAFQPASRRTNSITAFSSSMPLPSGEPQVMTSLSYCWVHRRLVVL
jgi:hypothetical protein